MGKWNDFDSEAFEADVDINRKGTYFILHILVDEVVDHARLQVYFLLTFHSAGHALSNHSFLWCE